MKIKKMKKCRISWTIAYLSVIFFVAEAEENVGFVQGLLSDCPGSWIPSRIKPESLRHLQLSVLGNGNILSAPWPKYNYYRVKEILRNPDFNVKNKTMLYVGGYWDSGTWGVGRLLGLLYKQMDYNVLLLETVYFTTTTFEKASRLMRPVGKHAAEMLAVLTKLGMDPKNLTICGISLGGQTVSFIAKDYRKITGQNISTIVALDAGGPCFRFLGPKQRLDPSDADFVIAIITNSDGFGMGTPVGTASFYVNGGEYQPGEISYMPCEIMCSHMRSYFVWISALMRPHRFIAVRCESVEKAKVGDCYDGPLVTNTLDIYIDRSKPGIYYLATSNRWPYALGRRGLRKRSNNTFAPYLTLMN
ncbi:phospholipase A1 member A-like [Leguminivora glycinivorella]|uniref:phospholipase A1 member A-like n=1 Tax=Leguminivora glycinivorella TaxID=1035111 RepID=UPI00200CC8F6|nr:phospholipase A1 member A-like [Leguminivora glycinivorella]